MFSMMVWGKRIKHREIGVWIIGWGGNGKREGVREGWDGVILEGQQLGISSSLYLFI